MTFQDYTICEDSLVSCWFKFDSGQNQYQLKYGIYTGLMSSRFANVLTHGGTMLLPGIGRDYDAQHPGPVDLCVLEEGSNNIAVLDFF